MSFERTPGRPLHNQIKDWLIAQLQDYRLEERLPSDRQLSQQLAVAPLTIKRVMGELEKEGYVLRKRGSGTFLASHDRRIHHDDVAARKANVMVAYPNYFSYEYWYRVRLTEEHALKRGMNCVPFAMNPDTDFSSLHRLIEATPNLKGLLIIPVPGTVNRQVLDDLDRLHLPVAIFGHSDHLNLTRNIVGIAPNLFQAGYLRAKFLLDRGHRAIGFVANEPPGQDGGQTMKGTKQALSEFGLLYRDLKRAQGSTEPWQDSRETGYRMTCELLDRHDLTALMYDSYAGVVGGGRALWERRIRVPEELSVICNGAFNGMEAYTPFPVTTVGSSLDEEMRAAFHVLLEGASQPARCYEIDVHIQERASVAGECEVKTPGGRTAPHAGHP